MDRIVVLSVFPKIPEEPVDKIVTHIGKGKDAGRKPVHGRILIHAFIRFCFDDPLVSCKRNKINNREIGRYPLGGKHRERAWPSPDNPEKPEQLRGLTKPVFCKEGHRI